VTWRHENASEQAAAAVSGDPPDDELAVIEKGVGSKKGSE
jgi:hypothetical protein